MLTVLGVFALALGAVVLRTALTSDKGHATPNVAESPRSPSGTAVCPGGQGCAGSGTPYGDGATGYLRLFEMVNAARVKAGCAALRLDDRLMTSARSHAADMAARAFAGLTNPDGDGPQARARITGYRGDVTEIIAVGLATADEVFQQWTNPRNPSAKAVQAKMTDCSRVSAGSAFYPAGIKPNYGQGIWVLDMGDV